MKKVAKLFSRVVLAFYIHMRIAWVFQLLHVLTNIGQNQVFLLLAISACLQWDLITVNLLWITLMTGNAGHLSCPFLWSVCSIFSLFLLDYLFHYYLVAEVIYIFWIHVILGYMCCDYFLPVYSLHFHFFNSIFQRTNY